VSVLTQLCEQYRGTLFGQSMFSEFEQAIHAAAEAGNPMSGAQMTQHYAALQARFHAGSFSASSPSKHANLPGGHPQ